MVSIKNIHLKKLYCKANNLVELDVTNNPELKVLRCAYNDIKELDFFNNQLTIHFYKEVKDKPHGPLSNEESIEIIKTFAKFPIIGMVRGTPYNDCVG